MKSKFSRQPYETPGNFDDDHISDEEVSEPLDGKLPQAKDYGVHLPRFGQNFVSPFIKAQKHEELRPIAKSIQSYPTEETKDFYSSYHHVREVISPLKVSDEAQKSSS